MELQQAAILSSEKRLDWSAQIKDDLCDCPMIASNKSKSEILVQRIVYSYPAHLSKPAIFFTQDGNLLLEWEAGGYPTVNIDVNSMMASFHIFKTNDDDFTKTFNLSEDSGFVSFIDFLSSCNQLASHGSNESFHETLSPYEIALERLADLEAGRSSTHPIEELMREYGLET